MMQGSIQKYTTKRGVRYLARVELPTDPTTGKRRQRAKSFRTKKEADAALAQWLAEVERGTAVDISRMTFGEYLHYWLNTYARHHTRQST